METNENGCSVIRSFHLFRDRYHYDCRLLFEGSGWLRVRTENDRPYFGVWVNPTRYQILFYMEGDEVLVTAPNEDAWHRELERQSSYFENFEVENMKRVAA